MSVIQALNGRWYETPNGFLVPSVTTVLGNVYPKGKRFARWLGEADSYEDACAKRDAAGDRGTTVHEAIQRAKVCSADYEPRVWKLIEGYAHWLEDAKPKIIARERFVYTDEWAGTLDLIVSIQDELWLLDVKTSSAVYPSHHAQTAAYALAWQTNGNVPVTRRGVLHLKTTTKKGYQLVESPYSHGEDFEAFFHCLCLYRREFGTVPDLPKPREEVTLTLEG